MAKTSGFERVWRFRVAPGSEREFERVYASTGAWAQLFGLGAGYLGTELQRLHDGEYVTIDRWTSRAAWEAFRRENGAAYDNLDRECESLTIAEELVRENREPCP